MTRWERTQPEKITLDVRPGHEPSGAPPVRIFLGSEASQFRPERILVWSVERVRDPARVYEIHLMKEIDGFDRRGWTTGFTNYRFAIPHFAGGSGRAIYNDEDQIYLSDPALLFDLDMQGHGFLAISPSESSVMLVDCERMAEIWTLPDARRRGKKKLIERAVSRAGVWGPLDPGWNARDGEYREGRSHLLHYTTLHTQPWRPFPERFVYMANPLSDLWHDLERSADDAGFQLFSRERPSAHFRALASPKGAQRGEAEQRRAPARPAPATAEAPGVPEWARTELDELVRTARASGVHCESPLAGAPPERIDAVAAAAGFGELPEDDVPWILDEMFRSAGRVVFVGLDACTPEPRGPARTTPPERWCEHLEAASRRHPDIHWELVVRGPRGEQRARGGRFLGDGPPLVWVLEDPRDPATQAAEVLAATLGWPWERRSAATAGPPWPDLVIADGPHAAAAARSIRARTLGRTRAVALGSEAGSCPDGFDLVVTPAAAGFFEHPKRLESALPLVAPDPERATAAEGPWREVFADAPAPRLALLVGDVERVSAARLRRLVRDVLGAVQARGGRVFAAVDPRVPAAALDGAFQVERAALSARPDAARAFLALADEVVFAGDADALLAEACQLGKPLTLVPLPSRRSGPEALRALVDAIARRGRSNDRGTLRPQQGLERICAALLERGRVQPPRDRERLNARLLREGSARLPEGREPRGGYRPLRDADHAAARVRQLLGAR